MSPKREENVKTLTGLSSQKDEFVFPDRNEAAILEISSLLGTDAETLLLYLVISQNGDLEEGLLSPARLKARFHAMNANYSVLHCKEYIIRHLGLDSLAREAWNYITSKCLLEDNHLDMIDWAVLFVQDLIRYSLLPENVYDKFPYKESTVNSWFKQPKDEGDETSGEVNVLNRIEKKQKQDEPYPLLDEKDFPPVIEEDGYKLLYHGTDHNSAVSILEEGINLRKGNDHMDCEGNDILVTRALLIRSVLIRCVQRFIRILVIPRVILTFNHASSDQCNINSVQNRREWYKAV